MLLFVDDTMFFTSNRNSNITIIQLQRQIGLATAWFKKWHLQVSASNTIVILLSQKRNPKSRQLMIKKNYRNIYR